MRELGKASLVVTTLALVLLLGAGSAAADTASATYSGVTATITVPDEIAPDTPFDVSVEGVIDGGSAFSAVTWSLYRDATWSYDGSHFVDISGTLIEGGFVFGNPFVAHFSQTLPAGTYTYTFVFGNRSFGHGWFDVAVDLTFTVGAASREVAVDVKPQSCPNPFNAKSKGLLSVAILGSADLDVLDVVPGSVTVAGVPARRWGVEDVATPVSAPGACECTTDGPDGYADLVLKFDKRALLAALGAVSEGEVRALLLAGELSDGTALEGTDCVVIRGAR